MTTSINLTQENEQRLDFLASQTGHTKAFFLREIIEKGLEDIEDYYLAAEVLVRIRKGKEKIYSASDVRKTWSENQGIAAATHAQHPEPNHPRK